MRRIFLKILMLSNGIVSLLGWNAILSSLDYFNMIYPKQNVYLVYPLIFMGIYNIVGVCVPFIAKYISYKVRIVVSLIVMNIIMIGLLLLAINSGEDNKTFGWSILLILLMSIFNMTVQSTLYGILNYYQYELITLFTTGTGLSGLIITILRIIAMSIFGTDQQKTMIKLYFIFTLILTFAIAAMNIFYLRSQHYKMIKQQQYKDSLKQDGSKQKTLPKIIAGLESTFPYFLFLFIIYVQTFTLFPGASLRPIMWNKSWGPVILILAYNLGDTIGKYLTLVRYLFNKLSITYLLIIRCSFIYFTYVMVMDPGILKGSIFPIIFQLILGITNGFLTFRDSLRQISGMINVFFLTFGIFIGTIVAFGFQWIKPPQ